MKKCFRCGHDLAFQQNLEDTEYQFDNALWISFHGGYGMFVDQVMFDEFDPTLPFEADYCFVLCHNCAHDFMDENPWLKNLFHPISSHSHTSEYLQANPTHVGWDTIMADIQNQFPGVRFNDSDEMRQAYDAAVAAAIQKDLET